MSIFSRFRRAAFPPAAADSAALTPPAAPSPLTAPITCPACVPTRCYSLRWISICKATRMWVPGN